MEPSGNALTQRNGQTSAPGNLAAGLLALARPEHAPTVFSGCIAGWWLGGAGARQSLLLVLAGAFLIFLGASCLKDAFNVSYDRKFRRTRPLPSRVIGLRTAWRAGLFLLLVGTLLLQSPGRLQGGIAMLLMLIAVMRNSVRRLLPFSPILDGGSRFLLYLLGASTGLKGITGLAIWCGLAAAVFVAGMETARPLKAPPWKFWPVILGLGVPVSLAAIVNAEGYLSAALFFAVLFVASLLACAAVLDPMGVRGQSLRFYIPAMVMADMLAACPAPLAAYALPESPEKDLCLLLGCLFAAALGFAVLRKRFVDRAIRAGTGGLPVERILSDSRPVR